jgi:hypothetical protein
MAHLEAHPFPAIPLRLKPAFFPFNGDQAFGPNTGIPGSLLVEKIISTDTHTVKPAPNFFPHLFLTRLPKPDRKNYMGD